MRRLLGDKGGRQEQYRARMEILYKDRKDQKLI